MSGFVAPDCKHLQPRGDLAPARVDWWWCETRGKEIYSAAQCQGCPGYQAGRSERPAVTEEIVGKAKVNWDGPASVAIEGAPEDMKLWEYAVQIGYGKTAKALGMNFSSVHGAVNTRKKREAAGEVKAEPARAPKTRPAPKSEQRCPEEGRVDAEPKPEPPVTKLQLAEDGDEEPPTVAELAGYIVNSGQGKRFAAWLAGARWAAGRVVA